MTTYLSTEQLLTIASRLLGDSLGVRDLGLLDAAAARPAASAFGEDAYVGLVEKAAALLHSLVKNHALVDGNKRLAFVATGLFLERNGIAVPADNEGGWYKLVLDAASGRLEDVPAIAKQLEELLHA